MVFQAMLVATLPYVDQVVARDRTASRQVREARQSVLFRALNPSCVEHMQAPLVLTYADIVDGSFRRSISLLGMTTTQLNGPYFGVCAFISARNLVRKFVQ